MLHARVFALKIGPPSLALQRSLLASDRLGSVVLSTDVNGNNNQIYSYDGSAAELGRMPEDNMGSTAPTPWVALAIRGKYGFPKRGVLVCPTASLLEGVVLVQPTSSS